MAYDFGKKKSQKGGKCIEEHVLYGQSVGSNPVPTKTASRENHPFVIFEDVKSKKNIGFSKYTFARGVLEIGAAGTGKTTLNQGFEAAILRTMEPDAINLVFDAKGDYLERHMQSIPKENLCVVGSHPKYRGITSYWNIFAEMMPRAKNGRLIFTPDSEIDALEMSASLFEEKKKASDKIFPEMTDQVVAALLVYFMKKYYLKKPSMLNNKSFMEFLFRLTAADIKAILEMPGMEKYRSCVNYIWGGKSGNQTQGVMSYISSLRNVFIGPFAEADSEREFAIREIYEGKKKMVIFVEYDLLRGNTMGPLYKILIDQLLKYSLGSVPEKRKNCYLLIDEWPLVPELKYMSEALSLGRSQGIKILCGTQNISAIEAIYGKEKAASILAGFQTVIAFRANDYETRQFLINHFGMKYQTITERVQMSTLNFQREGACLEDYEIQNLKCGEAAVWMVDEKPFFFHFPEYKW